MSNLPQWQWLSPGTSKFLSVTSEAMKAGKSCETMPPVGRILDSYVDEIDRSIDR